MEITTVKLQENGGYLVNDSMSVPLAEDNRHYVMVQEWIAEGNTPEPADPPPAPPTAQEVFDSRVNNDPVLKAIVDEMEAQNPNFRANARARVTV